MTRIVVLDLHGQFTHLERRALRDLGVDTELVDADTPPDEVAADGIVLSGGPDMDRVGRAREYIDPDVDVPVLGICLGMQLIADELDGAVGSGDYGGYADVDVSIVDETDPLVGSLAPETRVWASHADEVTELPSGFTHTATSDVCTSRRCRTSMPDSTGFSGIRRSPTPRRAKRCSRTSSRSVRRPDTR